MKTVDRLYTLVKHFFIFSWKISRQFTDLNENFKQYGWMLSLHIW